MARPHLAPEHLRQAVKRHRHLVQTVQARPAALEALQLAAKPRRLPAQTLHRHQALGHLRPVVKRHQHLARTVQARPAPLEARQPADKPRRLLAQMDHPPVVKRHRPRDQTVHRHQAPGRHRPLPARRLPRPW